MKLESNPKHFPQYLTQIFDIENEYNCLRRINSGLLDEAPESWRFQADSVLKNEEYTNVPHQS